jgi:hypothetical protein
MVDDTLGGKRRARFRSRVNLRLRFLRFPDPEEARPQLSTWLPPWRPLCDKWRFLIALAITAVVSGLAEPGVLAVVAHVTAALVDGTSEIALTLGSLHLKEAATSLVVVAFFFALARLFLQAVLASPPARIAADAQTQLHCRVR